MKKILALLLVLTMCLSFAACGEGSKETTGPEPAYETVEITMDNWQEYLEIRFDPQKREWHSNAFDEVIQCDDYLCLTVKDKYLDRIDEKAIDIAVGYSYVVSFIEYDIDFEKKSLTYGEIGIPDALKESGHLGSGKVHERTDKMNKTSMQIDSLGYYHESIGTPMTEKVGDQSYMAYRVVTITRIQGTIRVITSE